MSPRSEEFLDAARKRLRSARSLEETDPALALSAAYYAALYAARAALSERDTYSRTHRGTWGEFHRLFVIEGLVPAEAAAIVTRLQKPREDADYDAADVPSERAAAAVTAAEAFVAAVRDVLGDG